MILIHPACTDTGAFLLINDANWGILLPTFSLHAGSLWPEVCFCFVFFFLYKQDKCILTEGKRGRRKPPCRPTPLLLIDFSSYCLPSCHSVLFFSLSSPPILTLVFTTFSRQVFLSPSLPSPLPFFHFPLSCSTIFKKQLICFPLSCQWSILLSFILCSLLCPVSFVSFCHFSFSVPPPLPAFISLLEVSLLTLSLWSPTTSSLTYCHGQLA